MSVINRMLLELDERHDHAVQNKLPVMVRVVPARLPKYPYRARLLFGLLLVVALFAGLHAWRNLAASSSARARPYTNASVPMQISAAQPSLQLQAATTLESLPAAEEAQPIAVEPTPIPSAKPLQAKADRPRKTGQRFLLPARDEAAESVASPHQDPPQ